MQVCSAASCSSCLVDIGILLQNEVSITHSSLTLICGAALGCRCPGRALELRKAKTLCLVSKQKKGPLSIWLAKVTGPPEKLMYGSSQGAHHCEQWVALSKYSQFGSRFNLCPTQAGVDQHHQLHAQGRPMTCVPSPRAALKPLRWDLRREVLRLPR